jgi:CBS domain-containing protein
MSPRAACRLDALGFSEAYDYVAGKADWLAHGLPMDGEKAEEPRAKDVLRDDVVTVRRDEAVGSVRPRVEASPYGFALVVSDDGTLLGRLRGPALEGDPQAAAERVMEEGPSTVRPDAKLEPLLRRLRERDLKTALVTTPEGRLLGVLRRSEGEERSRQATRNPAAPA